jgi:hypothetical protein
VIGCACDGTEWIQDRNMFSVIGTQDYNKVQTTYGQFFKDHGVTNLGAVGYGIEPSSAGTAKNAALSAEHQGIKVGTSTPISHWAAPTSSRSALAMKDNGVNGLGHGHPDQQHLRHHGVSQQQGVNLKAALRRPATAVICLLAASAPCRPPRGCTSCPGTSRSR